MLALGSSEAPDNQEAVRKAGTQSFSESLAELGAEHAHLGHPSMRSLGSDAEPVPEMSSASEQETSHTFLASASSGHLETIGTEDTEDDLESSHSETPEVILDESDFINEDESGDDSSAGDEDASNDPP